jgi:hypothetical protein
METLLMLCSLALGVLLFLPAALDVLKHSRGRKRP